MASAGEPAKRSQGRAGARRRNRPGPRERLLAAATELFTAEGIRVIGIDRVLREADVAKASLYSLFGSKDALVAAYLAQIDENFRSDYYARAEKLNTPAEKILLFFDKYIEDAPDCNFRGSYFHNASTEFPVPSTEGEKLILDTVDAHRQWCVDMMEQLVAEHVGDHDEILARRLCLLADGGIAETRMAKDLMPLHVARAFVAEQLGVSTD